MQPPQLPRYVIADRNYFCPVQLSVHALAGKWKPLLIWNLLQQPQMRYGELKTALRSITHKMLTQSLRELESDGLVRRTVHEVVPPHVEYALSDQGNRLKGIFEAMSEFGEAYRIP